MLVCATSEEGCSGARLSKVHVLGVLARRSLPSLLEATVAPAVLFYVFLVTLGPGAAMLAALAWSYGALVRRWAYRLPVPTVLILAVLGLTVRTIVGITSGTFVYFLGPVLMTVVLAGTFLGSLLFGRPIIGRLAKDFCPLAPEIASRPAVLRLFTGLTVLWAAAHLLSGAATFGLLMSTPTATFVLLKTFVSLGITVGTIILTVSWSVRTARAENLVLARSFA
jgi:hypothetical protein